MPKPMQADIQFLINCCKNELSASDIEQVRSYAAQLDIEGLEEIRSFAHANGVFAQLYAGVEHHAAEQIAAPLMAELQQSRVSMVMQNMYMTAELSHVLTLFKNNGVEALAFKGPALAQIAYGDTTLREYCDLDILIQKQDIAQSISLLSDEGYTPEITLQKGAENTFFACVNVIGLTKKIRIEIHWELLSTNYAIDWAEADLWKQIDHIEIDGITVPVLAVDTHLLYICAHGAKHLFERLEWVCDIDRLIRSQPGLPWSRLFAQAQSLGIERILLLALYLCRELFSLPLPEDVLAKIDNDQTVAELGQHIIQLNFSCLDRQRRSGSSFMLLWRMREKRSDRLRFAYRAMFAPKFDDFRYLQLPPKLMFLYPVIRPFRLLMKYFGGSR